MKYILAYFMFLSIIYVFLNSFRTIQVLNRQWVFFKSNTCLLEVSFGQWNVILWISIFLIGKNNFDFIASCSNQSCCGSQKI
jgi:hypothetical protein